MLPHNRFLVVVRAGDASLHPRWTRAPDERDWDLVVSYFGDDSQRFRGAGERRIDDKGLKWPGLHALFTREDFWRRYDYVWLPDDDLDVDQESISRLFRAASALGLALAQPALSWNSHYSHAVTIRHPSFSARITDFVEIMAPCFERAFLQTCLPTLGENLSGWGLDSLWPRLLPQGSQRCAIIDEVEVVHTRPVGGPGHDPRLAGGASAREERDALLRRYGIPADTRPGLFAGIDRQGNRLDGARAADAAVLVKLVQRDWAAFLASRAAGAGSNAAAADQNGMDSGSARSTM